MAIAGETYEYTQMYPEMKEAARLEDNYGAWAEAQAQEDESKQHAQEFREVLAKAEKRFAALTKIETRHAEAYQQKLEALGVKYMYA